MKLSLVREFLLRSVLSINTYNTHLKSTIFVRILFNPASRRDFHISSLVLPITLCLVIGECREMMVSQLASHWVKSKVDMRSY